MQHPSTGGFLIPTSIGAFVARPAPDRVGSLLHTARIALFAASAGALYRLAAAIPPDFLDRPTKVRLALFYGTIGLTAVALQWGIKRRVGMARWSAMLAGALMAAALIRGRGAFATFWRYFPLPVLDVLLFLTWPIMIIGFVVAGVCCALAQPDTAGWR